MAKREITLNEAVQLFDLLGKRKSKKQIKELCAAYNNMIKKEEENKVTKTELKHLLTERKKVFEKHGVLVSLTDEYFDKAYINKQFLCQCNCEWADIYEVANNEIKKIGEAFKDPENNEKIVEKWYKYKSFFYNWEQDGTDQIIEDLNDEIKEKSLNLYNALQQAQYDFYSIKDAKLFEKFVANHIINSKKINTKHEETNEL